MTKTIPCSGCGAQMVPWRTGEELCTIPPYTVWEWRCACGERAPGGAIRNWAESDYFDVWWRAQQKPKSPMLTDDDRDAHANR